MSEAIQDFSIDIAEDALEDLRRRLAGTRWPDAETCDGWNQGVPLAYAHELASYWAGAYDWRRCERLLNGWQHFTTDIDGIPIHFIHRPSPNPSALPLLITHGWPGSVIEFHNVIEPLALGRPVLVGPHVWTIEYPGQEAMAAGVVTLCRDAEDLAAALAARLDGKAEADGTMQAFLADHAGATDRTLAALAPYLTEGGQCG